MNSPKYRELDREKLMNDEKYARKSVKSGFINKSVSIIIA